MNFGEQLVELRKTHQMSQEDLAKKIHVTRQTISKWELGITVPDMDILIDISKLFHISIDELVGNEEEKEMNFASSRRVYEYISKKKLFGIPLVHIHFGPGIYRAKGIIAIGNIATGILSIGLISFGIFSFGILTIGLLSCAVLSIGLLMALGSISIGSLAIGGVAIGLFSIGGLSIGMYSIGGCAISSNIALGGYAQGRIAIGDVCKGSYVFHTSETLQDFTKEELKQTICKEFPSLWGGIVELFCMIFQ